MSTANRKTRQPELLLIRTKFSRPPNRPAFVERTRLLDRLDEAVEHGCARKSRENGCWLWLARSPWFSGSFSLPRLEPVRWEC